MQDLLMLISGLTTSTQTSNIPKNSYLYNITKIFNLVHNKYVKFRASCNELNNLSNDNSHSPLFTLPSKLTLLSRSRLALVIKSFKSSSRTFQSIFSNNSLKSADSMYPLLSESKTRKACIMSSSLSSGVFCCSIRLMYSSKFSFPSPVIRQGAFFKVFISTKCRMCIVSKLTLRYQQIVRMHRL